MKANTTESELREAAEPAHDILAQVDALQTSIGKADSTIAALEAEIKELTPLALDDVAVSQRLAGAQVRLDLQQKHKAALEEKLPPLIRALRELLQTIPDKLRAYLHPTMEQLRQKLDSELSPLIPDAGIRLQAVNGHAAVHKLWLTMSCFWHTFAANERPVETARQVLAEISAILAGEKL